MIDIFPPDAALLYDGPFEYAITQDPAVNVQVVPYNPARVCLIMSTLSTQTIRLSASAAPPGAAGIVIVAPNAPVLSLSWPVDGPAVQSAWYLGAAVGAAVVYAVEWLLRRNPIQYGYNDAYKRAQAVEPVGTVRRAAPARIVRGTRRSASLPRFLRERLPGILTGD